MNIGMKILELRKNSGITQEKLAAEMGVSMAAVSKWENANSMPDIIMLCSLADYFNVTTDELLGRKNKSLNFIIADDSAFICESIEAILKLYNHKTAFKVNNGAELLEKLAANLPDGVFLDLNMPVMDGMTALKQIHEKYPDLKVIIVTADISEETKSKAVELGAVGYITKPFMKEHIEMVLREY